MRILTTAIVAIGLSSPVPAFSGSFQQELSPWCVLDAQSLQRPVVGPGNRRVTCQKAAVTQYAHDHYNRVPWQSRDYYRYHCAAQELDRSGRLSSSTVPVVSALCERQARCQWQAHSNPGAAVWDTNTNRCMASRLDANGNGYVVVLY